MFNPSKHRIAVLLPRWSAAALAAALLIQLAPSSAAAGVRPEERKNGFDAAAAAASQPGDGGRGTLYQVRCWQYGRLLFEENDVQFPNDLVAQGLKLRGTDRNKRPVYLAETRNATCLVRGTPADRGRLPLR